jgi:chromosome segregation ATPase
VVLLLLVTVVGFLARGVVSNMGQMRSIKISQGQIKEALLGDDDGDGESLKALMRAKNKEIEDLRNEMAQLRESVDMVDSEFSKVNESIDALSETVASMKADTKKAADISLESGLQITQLISIAMERKIPIVSDEARKMWYDNSRAKLLERAGVPEEKSVAEMKKGGEANGAEPGEKI